MISGEHILHFLVLITGCTSAGKLGTSEIYRVTNVATVSLRGYQPDEEKVAEIRKLLCCGTFYYSWSNDPRYGNTGCGVFKGGIQNLKGFWLKINCSQRKSLNFANWCNGDVSKSAKI